MTQEGSIRRLLREGIADLPAVAPFTDPREVAERSHQEVVRIGANENPLAPSPRAVEAAKQALLEPNRYPDPLSLELRKAVGERFGLSSEHVLVGNGGDEVISVLARTFLNEGDEVLIPWPAFGTYVVTARVMGAKLILSPLKDYAIDPEDMLKKVSKRTKLIYLCNPHNPSGTLLSPASFERILQALPERVILFSDEAYWDFVEEDKDYPDTLGHLAKGKTPHLVILRTFSKVYGLAGIRVGYLLAPPPMVSYMLRAKEFFNVNRAAQAAALAALKDEDHYRRSRSFIIEERRFLERELSALKIPFVPSQANFILLILGQKAPLVFEGFLDRGIIAREGSGFEIPETVRISVGSREDNERVLGALRGLWDNKG